jgi:hypothetical protein
MDFHSKLKSRFWGLDVISSILFLFANLLFYLFLFEGMYFVVLGGGLLNVLMEIGIIKRFNSLRLIVIFFLWFWYVVVAAMVGFIVLGFIISLPKLKIFSGLDFLRLLVPICIFLVIIWMHKYLRKPDIINLFRSNKI